MRSMRRAAPALLAAAVTLVACTPKPPTPGRHDGPVSESTSCVAVEPSAPHPPLKPPEKTETDPKDFLTAAFSNEYSYLVFTDTAEGATPDGHGHWTIRTVHLTPSRGRSDAVIIGGFDNASDACAATMLNQIRDAHPAPQGWKITVRPWVWSLPGAISEVFQGDLWLDGRSGRMPFFRTIVHNTRTDQLVTIRTLFTNESAGLQRLSEQCRRILPTIRDEHSPPLPELSALAPREENFANWRPTADGIEVEFSYEQTRGGVPATGVTVPWAALNDALAPGMADLAR